MTTRWLVRAWCFSLGEQVLFYHVQLPSLHDLQAYDAGKKLTGPCYDTSSMRCGTPDLQQRLNVELQNRQAEPRT